MNRMYDYSNQEITIISYVKQTIDMKKWKHINYFGKTFRVQENYILKRIEELIQS